MDDKRLTIEKCIASAHRSLSLARDLSSTYADLGLHDDLQLHLVELERLQVALLKSVRRNTMGALSSSVSQLRGS